MSRRERISDFTRPVVRNKVSGLNRVEPRIIKEAPSIVLSHTPTADARFVKREIPLSRPSLPRQDKSKVLRRQGLQKLPAFVPRKQPRKINYDLAGRIVGISIAVILIPVVLYFGYLHRAKPPGTYTVSNDLPRYLTSSAMMNVAAKTKPIKSIDDNDGSLGNGNFVGWYEASAKPGQQGVTVIAGQVTDSQNIGAFHNVGQIKFGDYIKIETGDGRLLIYRVREVRKYKPSDINDKEVLRPINNKEGLNLVTFTDKNNPDSDLGKYRYIVFAAKE